MKQCISNTTTTRTYEAFDLKFYANFRKNVIPAMFRNKIDKSE